MGMRDTPMYALSFSFTSIAHNYSDKFQHTMYMITPLLLLHVFFSFKKIRMVYTHFILPILQHQSSFLTIG